MMKPEQDVWLPHGANPVLVHGRADSVPTPAAREHEGVGAEANQEYGVA
jgi:hypothetical protein